MDRENAFRFGSKDSNSCYSSNHRDPERPELEQTYVEAPTLDDALEHFCSTCTDLEAHIGRVVRSQWEKQTVPKGYNMDGVKYDPKPMLPATKDIPDDKIIQVWKYNPSIPHWFWGNDSEKKGDDVLVFELPLNEVKRYDRWGNVEHDALPAPDFGNIDAGSDLANIDAFKGRAVRSLSRSELASIQRSLKVQRQRLALEEDRIQSMMHKLGQELNFRGQQLKYLQLYLGRNIEIKLIMKGPKSPDSEIVNIRQRVLYMSEEVGAINWESGFDFRNIDDFDKWVTTLANLEIIAPEPKCLPEGELVITVNGLKPIEQIAKGDLVLTHKGRFMPVTEVVSRRFTGNLLSIKTTNYPDPLIVTPEHPVLATTKQFRSARRYGRRVVTLHPEQWVPASDLSTKNLIAFPRQLEVKDRNVKDVLVEMRRRDPSSGRFTLYSTKTRLKITSDLMALSGWYLAEGTPVIKRSRNYTVFSLGKSEKESVYASEVVELARRVGFYGRIKNTRYGLSVVVYSKVLATFFEVNFGHGASHKRIPTWVKLLPRSKLEPLFQSYSKGDGSMVRYQNRCATVSQQLAVDLRDIGLRLGFRSSISRRVQPLTIQGRRVNAKPIYHIAFSSFDRNLRSYVDNDLVYFPVTKIAKIPYDGIVYNLHVAKDETYCTAAHTVHNCIVFLKPRRSDFDYGDTLVNYFMNKENLKVYALLRNGETVYRALVDIVLPDRLFPDAEKLDRDIENQRESNIGHFWETDFEYSWKEYADKWKAREKWYTKNFTDADFEEPIRYHTKDEMLAARAKEKALYEAKKANPKEMVKVDQWELSRVYEEYQQKLKQYFFGLAFIQGIFDRTDIFGYLQDKVNVFTGLGLDKYVKLVYDMSENKALVDKDTPSLVAWLKSEANKVKVGDFVVIRVETYHNNISHTVSGVAKVVSVKSPGMIRARMNRRSWYSDDPKQGIIHNLKNDDGGNYPDSPDTLHFYPWNIPLDKLHFYMERRQDRDIYWDTLLVYLMKLKTARQKNETPEIDSVRHEDRLMLWEDKKDEG